MQALDTVPEEELDAFDLNGIFSDKAKLKAAMDESKETYLAKVAPACIASQRVGNCYTGSVYMNLAALINRAGSQLANERVGLFSYGT